MELQGKDRDVVRSEEYTQQVIEALARIQDQRRVKRIVDDVDFFLRRNAHLAERHPHTNVYIHKPRWVGIEGVKGITVFFIVDEVKSEITLCEFNLELADDD